ncbi:hypothetical protein LTR37_004929 [Vermiconidia calcicola]|uniref:Uncharacterized protein n=1 Tax=Vermiconidia calcicola TaxID=1690605 RepID=A0ACC3NMD9_9PEZI|nr:hypothetical protein LTR37_004929 [Vermiconidia calcicola]
MFRNRRTSQKPSDELYKTFKDSFPNFNASGHAMGASSHGSASLTDALDISANQRPGDHQPQDMKDGDPTPRGSNEPWNFGSSGLTPSMMDPNSQSFNMFANQMPGYYTPTPGGTNTLYHHQAGDLHTPGLGIGLGTPLSLPTSEGALHAGQQDAAFHGFHPHLNHHLQQQPFHDLNPMQMHQQSAFPPHQFTHQPSFEHLEGPMGESPVEDMSMDINMHHQQHSPPMLFHPQSLQHPMQHPPIHPYGEKFRYHVTLNAPTAMIKHADEIPITYLNKGQAYTLNVVDTHGKQHAGPVRYRTFVRVSFEDEQQRQKPSACWQLWKEGRGTNEAHQRGGRLQAVEYVESGQVGSAEDPSKPRVELECASFDGFCVVWSPPAGALECPISVRFNFLSTDFSHSKGVKGIPVRLCAKTEVISEMPNSSNSSAPEVCYGKVKLFRDHGAERKLSNDIAHVKKTIDKLNQQIAQVESGMRDLGKRKRSSPIEKAPALDGRPGKIAKHRRTWSMSSVTSNNGRGSAEEDLHVKLMTLQDMFTSTRPASVLYLRGADEDDPDVYPVKLSGQPPQELVRMDSGDTTGWERQSINSQAEPPSTMVSPTPSSISLAGSRRESNTLHPVQQPTPFGGVSRANSNEWRNQPQTATMDLQQSPNNPQYLASPPDNQPIKVQTRSPNTGTMSGWVEALEVDSTYMPPPEPAIKPVACFYVQPRVAGRTSEHNFHRAIYLYRRTLKDFVFAIATKCDIEPTQVLRTLRISRNGLHVLFDDDCIRELPEGQDMTAEFGELQPETPIKPMREWDAGPTDVQCDGDLSTLENVSSAGYELRLLF